MNEMMKTVIGFKEHLHSHVVDFNEQKYYGYTPRTVN